MFREERVLRSIAVLLAAGALAACGPSSSGPDASNASNPSNEFPSAALTTLATDGAKARIEVRTAPEQPPTHGVISVELTILDPSSGAPLDGLGVQVQPFMPAMGHGSSVKPQVSASGSGRYVARNVDLFMPGRWELRTSITGAIEDHATPVLDVP